MTNSQNSGRAFGGSGLEAIKSRLLSGFSQVIDALEPQIDRAPANLRPAARKAVSVARERPFVVMAGLAFGALMLTRGARRR